jgi:hypothetical protein
LGSIATVERYYTDERIARLGKYQSSGYNFVTMTFNKKAGDNIFTSSDKAKE